MITLYVRRNTYLMQYGGNCHLKLAVYAVNPSADGRRILLAADHKLGYPVKQILGSVRLDNVICRTRAECFFFKHCAVIAGNNNKNRIIKLYFFLNAAQNSYAVYLAHKHVDKHNVGLAFFDPLYHTSAVFFTKDRIKSFLCDYFTLFLLKFVSILCDQNFKSVFPEEAISNILKYITFKTNTNFIKYPKVSK